MRLSPSFQRARSTRKESPNRSFLLQTYAQAWKIALPLISGLVQLDAYYRRKFQRGCLPRNWLVAERLVAPPESSIVDLAAVSSLLTPDTLWLHCASLGEAKGLWALVRSLMNPPFGLRPDSFRRILVTANTSTGLDYLEKECSRLSLDSWVGFPSVRASIAPLDHPALVKRFLKANRIRTLGLYETEIWPHYVSVGASLGVPVMLVSARMSNKAFSVYGRFSLAVRQTLQTMAWIQTQGEKERRRFLDLGGHEVTAGFDLKAAGQLLIGNQEFSAMPIPTMNEPWRETRSRLALVSLHEAELRQLLPELPFLLQRFDITIIPRHLKELGAFRRMLKPIWSQNEFEWHSKMPNAKNVLVDSMGMVDAILPRCRLALVGGSLISVGCHNLWEPLRAGLKLYIGPCHGNQQGLVEELQKRGLVDIIVDMTQIRYWPEPGPDVQAACKAFLEEQQASLDSALEECRNRIFATFQERRGTASAATQLRGIES